MGRPPPARRAAGIGSTGLVWSGDEPRRPLTSLAGSQAQELRALLDGLGAAWQLPDLAARVPVRASRRMTRMLGCYDLRRREIRVAAWLLESPDAPEALRREVICHEAAHAVVHLRHGRVARPHGPEWRRLMERAGLAARVRIPGVAPPRGFEHRCPVCDRSRVLGSRQHRLRCRACLASGRSGELVIRRLEPRQPAAAAPRRPGPSDGGRVSGIAPQPGPTTFPRRVPEAP